MADTGRSQTPPDGEVGRVMWEQNVTRAQAEDVVRRRLAFEEKRDQGRRQSPGLTTMTGVKRVRVNLRCDGCGTWERWQTPNPDLTRHDFARAHAECPTSDDASGQP